MGVEDKSVDLLLTDPPYNIGSAEKLTKQGNKVVNNSDAWGYAFKDLWDDIDNYFDWILNIIEKTRPKIKDDGSIILFVDRKFSGHMIYLLEKQGWIFRNKLFFIKNNPLPHFRKNNYRSTIEEAIWLTKNNSYNINFLEQSEMKQTFKGNIGSNKMSKHPTEKYKWMIEPILERHTNKDDLVLDLFSGSGAIPYYAKELERRFIGFEKKEEYYKSSLKLLNQK